MNPVGWIVATQDLVRVCATFAMLTLALRPAVATASEIQPGKAPDSGWHAEAGNFVCRYIDPPAVSSDAIRAASLLRATTPSALGEKRILLYRVDFSDAVGAAISSNAAVELITGLAGFYGEMSYGQMTFAAAGAGSEVTIELRLPLPSTAYDNNFVKLITDTRAVADTAGYSHDDFDFDIVCTGTKPFLVFGALAYMGAPGVWIGNNNFNVGVAGHELGHNLGLPHASFWNTGDRSTIGPGGREEYGDPFDSMGVPGGSTSHFNARYKQFLGWIPGEDTPRVTTNGTYRIFAHDHPQASGTRALRITRSAAQDYWIEFRQFFANRWLTNGASLRWGGLDATNTLLLDMTPGTSLAKTDSALVIGRTFSDPCGDLHITPVGKGQTGPESLDVVVNRGPFPDNLPPTVSVSASSTNVPSGATVSFQAAASDPNGDALAYYWEFGDTFFGSNQPAMDYRWAADGEYVARCTVSDMKGGRASQSLVVRVGAVSTFRMSGRVLDRGRPLEGVLVRAGSRASYTDTDGSYTVSRLPAGTASFTTVRDGYSFFPAVISNSVTFGPSATNIDFAALPDDLNSLSLVPPGAIWKYLDDGSDPGASWAVPGFDDTLWKSGRAKLGYGDGDEITVVDSGPDPDHRHVTTYFRHRFTVEDAGVVDYLVLRLRRDDGALVRLNGQEMARDNLPGGSIATGTFGVVEVSGVGENTFFRWLLPAAALVTGTNLLAVEIHQASTNSPDLGFDLELIGVSENPMTLRPDLIARAAGNRVELTWPMGTPQWLLQRADEIGTPGWQPATNAVSNSNGLNSISLSPEGEGSFYRLRKYLWCEPR